MQIISENIEPTNMKLVDTFSQYNSKHEDDAYYLDKNLYQHIEKPRRNYTYVDPFLKHPTQFRNLLNRNALTVYPSLKPSTFESVDNFISSTNDPLKTLSPSYLVGKNTQKQSLDIKSNPNMNLFTSQNIIKKQLPQETFSIKHQPTFETRTSEQTLKKSIDTYKCYLKRFVQKQVNLSQQPIYISTLKKTSNLINPVIEKSPLFNSMNIIKNKILVNKVRNQILPDMKYAGGPLEHELLNKIYRQLVQRRFLKNEISAERVLSNLHPELNVFKNRKQFISHLKNVIDSYKYSAQFNNTFHKFIKQPQFQPDQFQSTPMSVDNMNFQNKKFKINPNFNLEFDYNKLSGGGQLDSFNKYKCRIYQHKHLLPPSVNKQVDSYVENSYNMKYKLKIMKDNTHFSQSNTNPAFSITNVLKNKSTNKHVEQYINHRDKELTITGGQYLHNKPTVKNINIRSDSNKEINDTHSTKLFRRNQPDMCIKPQYNNQYQFEKQQPKPLFKNRVDIFE